MDEYTLADLTSTQAFSAGSYLYTPVDTEVAYLLFPASVIQTFQVLSGKPLDDQPDPEVVDIIKLMVVVANMTVPEDAMLVNVCTGVVNLLNVKDPTE